MDAVWCTKGMEHFGRVVADALGWQLFVDAPVMGADTVYVVGMYDPPNYAFTLDSTKGAKRRIIHWCGSDVYALVRPDMLPEATHIAETPWLRDELVKRGVTAQVVTFPTHISPEVTPIPDDGPVAVYLGSNPAKYGEAMVRALRDMLPDVPFHTYMYGTYPAEAMPRLISESKVCLRLVYPDGSANSAREFMAAGRQAITTVPLDYATVVDPHDLPAIASAVRRAMRVTEPDYEAASYYHEFNSVERYVAEVGGLL